MRILVLFLCIGFSFLGTTVAAQLDSNLIGDAVNITLSPQYPNPNELVTVSLDDYSIDSSGATIVWLLDGIEIPEFKNTRTISVIAPAVGKTATIAVRLVFSNRPTVSAEIAVTPLYVDVIVEPQTYTPIFYRGRALPVHGSLVNLTALVHGSQGMLNASLYTYNWQLNGTSVYGGPRVGNNRAQITVPFGQSSIIGITVTDATGSVVSRKLVAIPLQEVDITFYEESTLYGLSQRAIGDTLTLVGNSSTIRAVPYYIDTRAGTNALFTEWKINNRPSNTASSDPFEINLQRQGVGSAQISFKVRNLSELLQGDQASFKAQF